MRKVRPHGLRHGLDVMPSFRTLIDIVLFLESICRLGHVAEQISLYYVSRPT